MTEKTKNLVEAIKADCEKNYEAGGDTIVECYSDEDIAREFSSVEEAREFCGLVTDKAADCRWGEDSDPEVNRPAWQD